MGSQFVFVGDTGCFVSLELSDYYDEIINLGEWHTTTIVQEELNDMAQYDDRLADAAQNVLISMNADDSAEIHEVEPPNYSSDEIDEGEGACIRLANEKEADYLVSDDYKAKSQIEYELKNGIKTIHAPILLKVLVKLEDISQSEAIAQTTKIFYQRDWISTAIVESILDDFFN